MTHGEIPTLSVEATPGFADYALLDSGAGRKLERFGKFIVDRPEPQAMWQARLEPGVWLRSHAQFKHRNGDDEEDGGRWRFEKPLPEAWPIQVLGVTVLCRLTSFRHLGIFPEQLPHWQWMIERIQCVHGEKPRVLNLFAYTGAASLLAARAGADVTHLDASKKPIGWAKQNQAVSKMGEAPIRWILDDARKFVTREVRRGKTYNLILVDPPKFGRGPEGETWDLFTDLSQLLGDCVKLLDPKEASLALTVYAIRAATLAVGQLVQETLQGRGAYEIGELAIAEAGERGRLLPTSLFTRWTSRSEAGR